MNFIGAVIAAAERALLAPLTTASETTPAASTLGDAVEPGRRMGKLAKSVREAPNFSSAIPARR